MFFLFRSSTFLIFLFISTLFVACKHGRPADYELNRSASVKRYGQVIRVKPEKLGYYKELHANPWPCVLEKIHECNIRNYSIYLQDDQLFAYFEYVGKDFAADMAKMAADTCTQKWWSETDPCQEPIATAKDGDWWTTMEEVFHND